MPKYSQSRVEVVDEEGSEDSSDEIEIIPYVKPAPVIIDLLESGSESEEEKKRRKKAKKKKSKKDKEQKRSIDDASHESDRASGFSVDEQNKDTPSNATGGTGHLPTSQVCEAEQCEQVSPRLDSESMTGTSASCASSSNNESTLPVVSTGVEAETGLSGSDFERCVNAQSSATANSMTGANMIGIAQNTKTPPNQKQTKSKEKKSSNKETNKSRSRRISATQRTNEEIVNFLTTLGIEMEASAFDTPKRRRQPRKRQNNVPDSLRDSTSATSSSSIPDHGLGNAVQPDAAHIPEIPSRAFVSMTQESTSASRRKAVAGDLSDFQVSFGSADLDSLNTSFQSNIVMPMDNTSRKDSYVNVPSDAYNRMAEAIDAVARGIVGQDSSSTSPDESENVNSGHNKDLPLEAENSLAENTKDTSVIPRTEKRPILSETLPHSPPPNETPNNRSVSVTESSESLIVQVLSHQNARTSVPSPRPSSSQPVLESFKEYESPLTGFSLAVGQDQDATKNKNKVVGNQEEIIELESSSEVVVPVASAAEKSSNQLNAANKRKHEHEQCNSDQIRHSSTFAKDNYTTSCLMDTSGDSHAKRWKSNAAEKASNRVLTEPNSELAPGPNLESASYLPSTWTDHMKDFYDCGNGDDFDLDRTLSKMSGSLENWRVLRDKMPPPKNKNRYVRCDRCKQLGHFTRACTEKWKPVCCHMCGKTGHASNHQARRPCPSSLCLNCGEKLEQFSQRCTNCLLRRNPGRCELCNVIGHGKRVCPENWRRYHSITTPNEYELARTYIENRKSAYAGNRTDHNSKLDYKRKSSIFCCNCAKRGHNYYDCNQNRFNPYHRNKPFVLRDVPATLKSATPSSSTSTIPISFDVKTGRTVVLNTEAKEQPEIEVETIQVKIVNNLAVDSSPIIPSTETADKSTKIVPSTQTSKNVSSPIVNTKNDFTKTTQDDVEAKCKLHDKCTNKPKPNEQCVQNILMTQAHVKLLKAQETGMLKKVEDKHIVQISVIEEGNRIHICGSNTSSNIPEAEKDIYRFLWTARESFTQSETGTHGTKAVTSSVGVNTIIGNENTETEKSQLDTTSSEEPVDAFESRVAADLNEEKQCGESTGVPVYTIDDDEDDCCVVAELPVSTSRSNRAEADTISAVAALAQSKKELERQDVGHSENADVVGNTEKAYGSKHNSNADNINFVDDSPSDENYISFEYSDGKSESNGKPEKACAPTPKESRSNSSGTWDYESPLAGMNLSGLNDEETPAIELDSNNQVLAQSIISNDTSGADVSLVVEKDSDIEVITLDDDDEDTRSQRVRDITGRKTIVMNVTLLQSEFDLITSESMKKDSVMNIISSRFKVDLIVSKESSCVSITNGSRKLSQLAKDNIVFWLECQSSNSEFRILPNGYKELTGRNNNNNSNINNELNGLKNRSRTGKKRKMLNVNEQALQLNDIRKMELARKKRKRLKAERKRKRQNQAQLTSTDPGIVQRKFKKKANKQFLRADLCYQNFLASLKTKYP